MFPCCSRHVSLSLRRSLSCAVRRSWMGACPCGFQSRRGSFSEDQSWSIGKLAIDSYAERALKRINDSRASRVGQIPFQPFRYASTTAIFLLVIRNRPASRTWHGPLQPRQTRPQPAQQGRPVLQSRQAMPLPRIRQPHSQIEGCVGHWPEGKDERDHGCDGVGERDIVARQLLADAGGLSPG